MDIILDVVPFGKMVKKAKTLGSKHYPLASSPSLSCSSVALLP